MTLKDLKEKIEEITPDYDFEGTYSDLYNACIDYMNEHQVWDFEYLFQDIIDYDTAEQIAKNELENGGLVRLYYFLGDANCNNDIFVIDGYGNLRDVTLGDLECLKSDILGLIEDLEGEE